MKKLLRRKRRSSQRKPRTLTEKSPYCFMSTRLLRYVKCLRSDVGGEIDAALLDSKLQLGSLLRYSSQFHCQRQKYPNHLSRSTVSCFSFLLTFRSSVTTAEKSGRMPSCPCPLPWPRWVASLLNWKHNMCPWNLCTRHHPAQFPLQPCPTVLCLPQPPQSSCRKPLP